MSQKLELRNALQQFAVTQSRCLVLLAADYSVMAYSIHESRRDRSRLAHIMTHSDLWKTTGSARYEVGLRDLGGVGTVALVPLIGSDLHLLGMLVYPLEEGEGVGELGRFKELEGLSLLTSLLEIEKSIDATFTPMVSTLLADLVSDTSFTRDIAVQELYDRKLIAHAEFYTVVLLGAGGEGTTADNQRVRRAVAHLLRFVNSRSTSQILGGMLTQREGILIFPREVQQEQLDRVMEEPGISPIYAGISPMVSATEFHSGYLRAMWALRTAIRLKDRYGRSVTWRQAGINGFIAAMPIEELEVDDLPRPLVDIMKDRSVGRWLDTLEAFVEYGGDIQRTAQGLQIHRSTVYYRLERFSEVAQIDITDKAHHAELLFALRLVTQLPLASSFYD